MNEEQLAAIEARVSAATPGPWYWVWRLGNVRLESRCRNARNTIGNPFVMVFRRWRMQAARPWFRNADRDAMEPYEGQHPDANFIAHAATDVPALISEVRAAWAERDAAYESAQWNSTQKNDVIIERDELRAILAPLLADPIGSNEYGVYCDFCHVESDTSAVLVHAPDCPVLRRDALLGQAIP